MARSSTSQPTRAKRGEDRGDLADVVDGGGRDAYDQVVCVLAEDARARDAKRLLNRQIVAYGTRMPAYVIASVTEARDQEKLAEYRERNTDAVARHGGRFIVRGGPHETLEGHWAPVRLVIMEFPDMEAARGWYESDEYAPLRELRQSASDTDIVVVEGV